MKRKNWFLRLAAAAVLCGVLVTTALAAEAGSAQDPLVTLSYLNETFMNTIMARVDEKIAARGGQLGGQVPGTGTASAAAFTVVILTNGQTLTGDIGCEVMLRVGSAVCVAPSDPGLIDETTAETLAGGKPLAQNHLYMMTIEGRGVRATAATTKLLVRGAYTVA